MNTPIWKTLDRQRNQITKPSKFGMQDTQQIANIYIIVCNSLLQKAYLEHRDHDDIFHSTLCVCVFMAPLK